MMQKHWGARIAGGRCVTAWLVAGILGCVAAPCAAQCAFDHLQWNSGATRVQFDVTCGAETRRASVDVASGALWIEDARVQEPVQCSRRGTILFRDALGILECAEQGTEPARLVLPAPENGAWFLRAYGEDASGRFLAWLYERDGTRHVFVSLDRGADAPRSEWQPSGPEALRAWTARQRGIPFARAGERFRHTVCAQFRGRKERVCVEPLSGVEDQSFRLTTGRPGAVAEWTTHVWPSGWSMAPDSSAVLVGLLESEDKVVQCGTWIVGPERARRVGQSRGVRAPLQGNESWVLWRDATRAWWADAAGALWSVDCEAAAATVRLAGTDSPPHVAVPAPAAGAASPAVSGPRGVRAWVRTVTTPRGLDCELWVDPGSGARRVVAPLGAGIGG